MAGLVKKERLESYCRKGAGLIPQSKWISRSVPQKQDYDDHSEMDADSFKDWFVNISKFCIRVVHYNHRQCQLPYRQSKRGIQERLRKNFNEYFPTETIPELLLRVASIECVSDRRSLVQYYCYKCARPM
jgi:hypothetical protein